MELDYTRRCRTCLASGVKLYKLNGPISNNTSDTVGADILEEQKSTIIEYLRYCTRLPDVPELPAYICVNCCSALQVAYNFIRNALHAHDVLCHKLCPAMRQRCNGLNYRNSHEERKRSTNDSREDGTGCDDANVSPSTTTERAMRFRCKVCGEKVDSKKSLKEHVKLHLDIISYSCELCAYQCKRRSELSEHYKNVHAVEPSREQLKAQTALSTTTTKTTTTTATESIKLPELNMTDDFLIKDDIFAQMEAIHNTPTAELEQQAQEISAPTLMQQEIDGGMTIISGDVNVNCTNNLQNLPQDLTNEMTVGNEFIVMADGTVEEVMENGVVIQYINATDTSSNVGMEPTDLLLGNAVNMDVDDIIIEENISSDAVYDDTTTIEQIISQTTTPLNSIKSISETGKQIKCKICAETFYTQNQLKTHMLTHNEIPHFFCDRCTFYTFFKVDLTQHYKMQHNLEPTYKQLLPKNKLKTTTGSNLSNSSSSGIGSASSGNGSGGTTQSERTTTTGARLGRPLGSGSSVATGSCGAAASTAGGTLKKYIYSCDLCLYETGVKMNLRKHYMSKHKRNATDVQLRPSIAEEIENCSKVVVDAIRNLRTNELICRKCNKIFNTMEKFHEHYKSQHCVDDEHSKNSTLPLDALPQIVEVDNCMDDNAMDTMFEDIYEDEDYTEDIEGLILTSDDDFEDNLEDPKRNKRNAYCVHCNKIFYSQYQFENHMFVHRGLAPYRCEMCTNLYNTKRALIRHYRAVHKKLPTRDMIQAKGDKVVADNIPVEDLQLEQQKSVTLMCAKCPFESTEYQNIQIHLKTSHGLIDETYILEKLPFECPRCIRSFELREHLLAHLERSHSVSTIIQRRPQSMSTQARRTQVTETTTITTTATSVTVPTNAIVTATTNFNTTTVSNYAVISSTSSSSRNNNNNNNNNNNSGNSSTNIESIMSPAQRCGGSEDEQILLSNTSSTNSFITTTITTAMATMTTSSNSNSSSASMNLIPPDTVQISSKMPNLIAENIDQLTDTLTPSDFVVTLHTTTNGKQQFLCNTCTFAVESLRELDAHSQTHPSDETRDRFNFKCPICHRKYRTLALLRHHMKRHVNRKYSCTDCPKTFITRSEYVTHQRTHDAAMRYTCNMCEKEFRYAHHLKRHKDAQHYGKRHLCPVDGCGRQFTTMAQLRIHTWSHSGNMPYRCTHCNTVFKRRGLLREHALKMHSIKLSENDIAKIYRENVGHTNPYDFTVSTEDGQMLRRSDTSAPTNVNLTLFDD